METTNTTTVRIPLGRFVTVDAPRHSIIIANHSTTDGGGISVNAIFILPTITISDCTIANNSAAGRGGGFAMLTDGPVTISKSTFANNQATEGGGIYVYDFYLVHLTQTTLVANTAATDGGGMWFDGFGGHLEVDDNVVAANNSAGRGAGGISQLRGTASRGATERREIGSADE